METKIQLRKLMKLNRDRINQTEKNKLDELIFHNIINNEIFIKAKCIFIYVSFKSEVDTYRIINYAIKQQKKVCVPKVISLDEGMKAVLITDLKQLKENSMGILEPEADDESIPENIDLVIMPGLAFDLKGGRLGYGGGFYDRFMQKIGGKVSHIALSYEFQILDNIPMGEFDIPVDGIITEKRTYTI